MDAGRYVNGHLDDGIYTIVLDSPHNRNALSKQLVEEAHEHLDRAEEADSRAIVLTHDGPAFCAGADLKERSSGVSDSGPFVRLLERLMDTDRPTIAAATGPARAGGIGLLTACDLVVVDASVTFALTEVRIGVAAAIISVPILRRVSPSQIAAPMLTGETFSAHDARAMGLITHVSDDVMATVTVLCNGIRAGAPGAVRATKRLMREVPALDRSSAFDAMRALSDELFAGDEASEGMAAFREKRPPSWQVGS